MTLSEVPKPLNLSGIQSEPWSEIIYYEEFGLGEGFSFTYNVKRNLNVTFRKLPEGRYEVEAIEVARKLESQGSGGAPGLSGRSSAHEASLDHCKKYVNDLPLKWTTDEWGLCAPMNIDQTRYPRAFWGFYLPRKLAKGQRSWTASLQPPFHATGPSMPTSNVQYSFRTPSNAPFLKPDIEQYTYSSDQAIDPPFGDEHHLTIFRLNGICNADKKLRRIILASSDTSWIVYDEGNKSRLFKARGLTIRHTLERGARWDIKEDDKLNPAQFEARKRIR